MLQLALILNVLKQPEEFNFTRDKVRNLSPDCFELDVVTPAIELAFLLLPHCVAMLGLVLVLAFRDHQLEAVGLALAELETNLVSRQVEGSAHGLTGEHLRVKGLRKLDCCLVEDGFALLAADDMRHIALPKDFSNELRHASRHEDDLDLRRCLLQDPVELTLADEITVSILCLKKQIAVVFLARQPHALISLIEPVAGNVKHARLLADHFDEFVLRGH